MRERKTGWVLVGLATAAVALLGAQFAIAFSSPANTVVANGALHQAKVVRSNDAFSDNTSSWVSVTGMTVNVKAPTRSLVVVTFAAESQCLEATDTGWCSLRARIGAGIGEPNEGTDNAFDNGSSNGDEYEGHALIRSRIVPAGTHTVRIQMNANGLDFRLDDMSLEVQVIDV
jgi:hypothetical protein